MVETFISSPVIGQLPASLLSHWLFLKLYPVSQNTTQLQKIELITFFRVSLQLIVLNPLSGVLTLAANQHTCYEWKNYFWFLIGQFITNPGSHWTIMTSYDSTHCSPLMSQRLSRPSTTHRLMTAIVFDLVWFPSSTLAIGLTLSLLSVYSSPGTSLSMTLIHDF